MQPVLTVNLTHSEIGEFTIPVDWEHEYLGGASLAARILFDQLVPELDPLSPEAPLLFLNGPLSGTAGPAVGRFVVCGKSPATQLWAESNCGGFWGPELRKAGYDGLLVTGKAGRPVYLWIDDGKVEIRPGDHLWGLDTYQTQERVVEEIDRGIVRVASIGIAGESMIPIALILCDHGRVAGRTGMGAVMGSKNLKAVAVKGTGEVPVVDFSQYKPVRSEANRNLRADAMTEVLRKLGSSGAAEYFDYLGEMPKRYYQQGTFKEEIAISGADLADTILVGVSACHACVIACGRVVRLEDGEKRKGPEYETLVGFGPNLWLNDAVMVTRLGELCDRYGMDTISLSNTIGLAFTLFERGIVSEADTGGLALNWGDAQAVEQLVHQTGRKEGFGAFLAEGARALGRRFGVEELAVQVNGLEIAYHDPRGASGMALVYATSPRGACHNQSDYFMVDIGQVEASLDLEYFAAQGGAEKAANVARHQDWRTVFNAMVLCFFANVPPDTVVNLINSACGYNWKIADLMRAGERGWTIKRVINNRLGLTAKNDQLPELLLRPYTDDIRGFVPEFDEMLQAYYLARDWDPLTGYPTREKLTELKMEWLLDKE